MFFVLYSNGAILVYDITDEDSFFKVTHVTVYLIVTIKVTIMYTCNPTLKPRSFCKLECNANCFF